MKTTTPVKPKHLTFTVASRTPPAGHTPHRGGGGKHHHRATARNRTRSQQRATALNGD